MKKEKMAELLVNAPEWNGAIKDAKTLCSRCSEEEIRYLYEEYDREVGWSRELSTQEKYAAQEKYDKQNTQTITLKLNKKTDAKILAWLNNKKNKQGAIKAALSERSILETEGRTVRQKTILQMFDDGFTKLLCYDLQQDIYRHYDRKDFEETGSMKEYGHKTEGQFCTAFRLCAYWGIQ